MTSNQPSPGSTRIIIIPCFNESEKIGRVISRIREVCDFDVLVVDDGSTDDTVNIAESSGAIVVSHPFNLGYGAAIQTGYKYAKRHGYRFLVQLDGDGQHDPAYIKPLVETVQSGKADIAIGSRFGEVESYKVPFNRKVGIALFSGLTRLLIGVKIKDVTSGMQAMNERAFNFFCGDLFPTKHPDADIIIWATLNKLSISEIPVKMERNDRKSMHSGLFNNVRYVFRMIFSIIVMRYLYHVRH